VLGVAANESTAGPRQGKPRRAAGDGTGSVRQKSFGLQNAACGVFASNISAARAPRMDRFAMPQELP
jgi:hypothetical protein